MWKPTNLDYNDLEDNEEYSNLAERAFNEISQKAQEIIDSIIKKVGRYNQKIYIFPAKAEGGLSYDIVVYNGILNYLDDLALDKELCACYDSLKSSGYLIIAVDTDISLDFDNKSRRDWYVSKWKRYLESKKFKIVSIYNLKFEVPFKDFCEYKKLDFFDRILIFFRSLYFGYLPLRIRDWCFLNKFAWQSSVLVAMKI
jgi:hypothetical protein